MNRYTKSIAVAILLVAATTLTKAQNAPGNALPPAVSKFNDIVEMNLDDIGTANGLTMGFSNIFAYRTSQNFSIGAGIGIEAGDYYSYDVPLSVDLRYYFNPTKSASPFLNLYGGYEFNFDNFLEPDNENPFLGLNFGVNLNLTNNMSLQLALGLKLEHYGGLLSFENPGATSNYLSVPFTIGLAF